jgi:16S rRNA (uracil1498-N3)-methyltransferase
LARRRFFVDAIQGGLAELSGDDARHLRTVLRAELGQRFEISDNRAAYLAEIVEVRKERIVFRVIEPAESIAPAVRVTALPAVIKFDRFEWMIEKATELGVERIVPIGTARVEKGLLEASHKRLERWKRIVREASQQSRRLHLPELAVPARFDSVLATTGGYRYILDESPGAPPLLQALPAERREGTTVTLLFGPEGGWTTEERERAVFQGWAAASLGPQILRAETAVLAALAVVFSAWLGRVRY